MLRKLFVVSLVLVGLVGCSKTKLINKTTTQQYDSSGVLLSTTVVTDEIVEDNKLIGSNAIELASADAIKRLGKAKSDVIARASDPKVMTKDSAKGILDSMYSPDNRRNVTAVDAPKGADTQIYLYGSGGGLAPQSYPSIVQ